MGNIRSFRELKVWQKGMDVAMLPATTLLGLKVRGLHCFVFLLSIAPNLFADANMPPIPPPDDLPNFLFVLALCATMIMAILLGIGAAGGIFAIVCAAILAVIGIVSTSVIIAALRRRVSAGVRAMHYQLFALLALPGGIALAFTMPRVTQIKWTTTETLILGSIGGIGAGLAFALLLDISASIIRRRFFPATNL